MNKVIKTLLLIIGILCLGYGLIVNALISSVHWFNYVGFIFGGVLILVSIFLEHIKAFIKKLPKLVLVIVCALLAVVLAHFSWFEVNAIKAANSVPDDSAKYMIVLGAKVNGTVPSLEYQRRIEKALEYAKDHKELIVICTGGQGNDENIAESVAAYNYLLEHGIEESRLFKEEKSTSTTENFLFAKEAIAKSMASFMSSLDGAKDIIDHAEDLQPSDVIIVSSEFHLYRAGLIAKRAGYSNLSYLGSSGRQILKLHYYLREYAAYVRELL